MKGNGKDIKKEKWAGLSPFTEEEEMDGKQKDGWCR